MRCRLLQQATTICTTSFPRYCFRYIWNASSRKHFTCGSNLRIPHHDLPKLTPFCFLTGGSCLQTNVNLFQHGQYSRHFHLSSKRNLAFPPLIAAVIRLVGKPAAIIFGRYFRKKWASLPVEVRKSLLTRNKNRIYYGLGAIGLFGALYYYTHLEETPFTGRKKFSVFSQEQFGEIVNQQRDMLFETLKEKLVPAKHPAYGPVNRVAMRLIYANQDVPIIKSQKWSVTLVNDKEKNAFVLPNGHIFVYLGMLEMVANDDQLGVVLGHEMAHTVLGHGAEQFSVLHFAEYVVIIFMTILWAILPTDLISGVATFVMNKMTQLLLHLPYGRLLENEADGKHYDKVSRLKSLTSDRCPAVGLQLSAKACFDVRESVAFWNRMNIVSEFEGDIAASTPEFLSTHPTHESRAEALKVALPKALELRHQCHCPPLPSRDPSVDVARFKAALGKAKHVEDPWKPFVVVIT